MRRLHIACAALMLLALVGCSSQQLAALTTSTNQIISDGKQLQAQVEQTNATAKALLATTSTTQPTYKPLAATTQALTTVDANMGKALDVAAAGMQVASAKNLADPSLLAGLQAINAAVPNPYTPFIAMGIPLALALTTTIVGSFNHKATTTTLTNANATLTSSLVDAHAALGDAKAVIAVAQATGKTTGA